MPTRTQPADTPSLFDEGAAIVEVDQVAPTHADARAAEKAGATAIRATAGSIRSQVLQLAVDDPTAGVTNLEAARVLATRKLIAFGEPTTTANVEALALRHLYSVAPRLTELVKDGWLTTSDDTREDRMVYRATGKALANVTKSTAA